MKRKGRSVVKKGAGGKSTTEDAEAKAQEKILIEHEKSGDKVAEDLDRNNSESDRSKGSNASVNTKEENDLGVGGDNLKGKNAPGGDNGCKMKGEGVVKEANSESDKPKGRNASLNAKEENDSGVGGGDMKGKNAPGGDNGGKMTSKGVVKEAKRNKSMTGKSSLVDNSKVGKSESSVREYVPKVENVEVAKTPTRRSKRGADAEIASSFLLSLEKGTSRLRPRKDVPSFQKVVLSESDFDRIVGKRVKIFWSGSRRWFIGRIKSFDNGNKLHKIFYDDGDKEELDLKKERFELEVSPSEAFTLLSKTELNEKKGMGSYGDGVRIKTKKGGLKVSDTAEPIKHAQKKQKMESKYEKRSSNLPSGKGTEDLKMDDPIKDMELDAHAKSISGQSRYQVIGLPGEINNPEKEKGISNSKDNDGAEPVKRCTGTKRKVASKTAKSRHPRATATKDTGKDVDKPDTSMDVDIPQEVEKKSVHGETNVEKPEEDKCPKNPDEVVFNSEVPSEKANGISDEVKASKPESNFDEKDSNVGKVSGNIVKADLLKVGETEPLKKLANVKKKLAVKEAKDGVSKSSGGNNNDDVKSKTTVLDMEVDVLAGKAREKVVSGEINVEDKADEASNEAPSTKNLTEEKNLEILEKQKIQKIEAAGNRAESGEKNALEEMKVNTQYVHQPENPVRKTRTKVRAKK
ncbi:PREDICTED: uncharacterized protein LOC104597399 [Nelumbo nucifera]|uniref:Uncharacterized protein LOC104597399 n=2 Tax=Nelumbo nucifera TaxID=4432 RepID=A0A1U8A6Z0_NELNU|nr:PREDICTED: uncharacterized protein LOC104597399 [Nelumbo nucifera]XP_010257200.1 PREDICTED: uncharacterized protein LOC104597399 [Nelumbo nucifera]DAD42378.1 TPA_asm: hypothetical protein HUJ06_000608 [Nelumbo nucifera]